MDQLHGDVGVYITANDNFLLLGDINIFRDDERLKEFRNSFSLGDLIKTSTCYMDTNPSSINYVISNMISFFIKSCLVETRISDHHKLIMSICRTPFAKGRGKKFFYRCYKNFNNKLSEKTLIKNLPEIKISFLRPLLA